MVALAEVLIDQVCDLNCDVLQFDEPIAAEHPGDGAVASSVLNMVLASVQAETAVHFCSGREGRPQGCQLDLAPLLQLVNQLQVDHVMLELSQRQDAEIKTLKEIRSGIRLGVGVIDVRSSKVESSATVARRIQRVADVVGQDRIAYVHPDCGLWTLPRDVADAKLGALVQGRNEFLGDAKFSSAIW